MFRHMRRTDWFKVSECINCCMSQRSRIALNGNIFQITAISIFTSRSVKKRSPNQTSVIEDFSRCRAIWCTCDISFNLITSHLKVESLMEKELLGVGLRKSFRSLKVVIKAFFQLSSAAEKLRKLEVCRAWNGCQEGRGGGWDPVSSWAMAARIGVALIT